MQGDDDCFPLIEISCMNYESFNSQMEMRNAHQLVQLLFIKRRRERKKKVVWF